MSELHKIIQLLNVKVAYDPEAEIWYVEDSDLYGVNAWGYTLQELSDKLLLVALDLKEGSKRG